MKLLIEESPVWLWLTASDKQVIAGIYDKFKVHPPDYWRSPTFQLYKRTDGEHGWDGYVRFAKPWRGPLTCCLPRGFKEELLTHCEMGEIDVQKKLLTSPLSGCTVDDVPAKLLTGSFELDYDQRMCICELLQHGFGLIEATVSAGKTAIFLGLVCMVKKAMPSARFLYIVPTERLVKQVYSECGVLAKKMRVSQFGGGKRDKTGADIVVATSASVALNIEELEGEGWLRSFTGLIYDEVHRAGSPSGRKICDSVPAFFRWGGSDSVKDTRKEDALKGAVIRSMFGPVRHRIKAEGLIEIGRLAKPNIYLVDVEEWQGKFDDIPRVAMPDTVAWCLIKNQWQKGTYVGPVYEQDETGAVKRDRNGDGIPVINMHNIRINDVERPVESRWCLLNRQHDKSIIRFRERNELIVRWARYYAVDNKWPTLVVATRTLHCIILESMLLEAGCEVRVLTGQDSTKTRDEVFAWLLEKHGRVLVSPLVKEGVSLPDLKAGVIADYVAGPDTARQILGRFIRRKPTGDNHAHVTMFIERQADTYHTGSKRLLKELDRLRGFTYYWPVLGPDSIATAAKYDAANTE